MAKETITSGAGVLWSAIVTLLNNMFTEIYSSLKTDNTLTNAIVGTTTFAANTTGNNLAGLGYGTFLLNTEGRDNVAVGALALRNNTVGSGCVAIGNQALYSNTTEFYNIGIGDACLKYATGGNNTALGSYCGHLLETGTNNIFLGNRAGYNQTVNSNLLIIDSRDRGSTANELAGAIIYGVMDDNPANQTLFLNGKVGIKTQDLGLFDFKINGDANITGHVDVGTGVNIANPNWGMALSGSYLRINGSDGFQFYDTAGAAELARIVSATGNLGIGTTDPKSKLHVVGIPVYADNAAAIAGGLTAGAFYRTGADPDPLMVVH